MNSERNAQGAEGDWSPVGRVPENTRLFSFHEALFLRVGSVYLRCMCRNLPFLVALVVGGSACTEQPSRIEVKGPADTLRAAHGITALPVFEEKQATIKLRVSAFDDQDRYMGTTKVSWTSLDPSVASVNQSGLVTILQSGITEVVATTLDSSLTDEIEVKAVIIGGIKIVEPKVRDGDVPKLPLGEFLRFAAEVSNDRGDPIEDARVRWESTTWAATISSTGEVEGRAIGKTTIVATAANGDVDEMEIQVTDWPKKRRRRRR